MAYMSEYVNISVSNVLNQSDVDLFDLYEHFKEKESQQIATYKIVAYIFGIVIFLSNLTVVISSGLILKKGLQPKSTYMLLGNVSLADTITGLSIVFGVNMENLTNANPLCIFQTGMLVCPAMVSIFSVGLIAVDRYIYILHGLYYQRWFSTTKVRIGILCFWLIGLALGFLPAIGFVNTELRDSRCYYVALFPGAIILLNSLLSIVPIILVAVLYSIILVKALKNVKEINATVKSVNSSKSKIPEMRINRGNVNLKKSAQSVKIPHTIKKVEITRSASFDGSINRSIKQNFNKLNCKSKSNDDLNDDKKTNNNTVAFAIDSDSLKNYESDFSIQSIHSSYTEQSNATDRKESRVIDMRNLENGKQKTKHKIREPNKWRAIIIVMLTSGSFIVTWMPFFITVIFFVFCQEKQTNPKCLHLRMLLGGPLATLAFLNSILNPLIYAWWHKGFQRSIRTYFRRHLQHLFRKDVLR
ncbi:glucose-dependent insulinotropic receptor-like [Vanessa cardui]|uniref:glucose-dependent insulinotropic receptor-like n=1 Tax=Vanessa cardui TaxID=171605 RepID=UPI001F130376|nr:glucose-dependent insulinotropic receptor-like [Vanessa cardui]